ncbi:MAG TPA: phosphatase domain-containing protein [Chthoniobacterales bacterium]|nr:phosphatase domain-containing protein [Chthoniobacterales bacterium]
MRICPYLGYATRTHVQVSGRVLANSAPRELHDGASVWRNLIDAYHRFETDEVPNTPVSVQFEGQEHVAVTDSDGYYHCELPRSAPGDSRWLTADARCKDGAEEVHATHEVIASGGNVEFGIISDLDDTVIETNVTSFLTAAKLTFIGHAKTRKPLKGVAALYASLQSGRYGRAANPIFYVSSSPWNLYDLPSEFMALNEIPKGPMFLRDYELHPKKLLETRSHRQKLDRTLKIMADFPELPFVLVGDSGQHDAPLYAEAAALHPARIKAIYIRDVDPTTATKRDDHVREHIKTAAEHGVPMLLAADSQAMAHHAAELGLIAARKEAEVEAEVAKDHERPSAVAAAVSEALG